MTQTKGINSTTLSMKAIAKLTEEGLKDKEVNEESRGEEEEEKENEEDDLNDKGEEEEFDMEKEMDEFQSSKGGLALDYKYYYEACESFSAFEQITSSVNDNLETVEILPNTWIWTTHCMNKQQGCRGLGRLDMNFNYVINPLMLTAAKTSLTILKKSFRY